MTSAAFLKKTLLFHDLSDQEIHDALQYCNGYEVSYEKGEILLNIGEKTKKLGMVTDGRVTIAHDDLWGNRVVITSIPPRSVFAETYAWFENYPMTVQAYASSSCKVLWLSLSVLKDDSLKASWHDKLQHNLLTIANRKNLQLMTRNLETSPHSARARILAYLNDRAVLYQTSEFDIPFDRQQLADYLNLDRSALSRELSNMKKEGLIDYHKNHFRLMQIHS